MSVKISQLIQIPVVWGNAVVPIVSRVSGANVTYTATITQIDNYVSGGLYNAIDQTTSILNANIALANVTLRVYTDGQITAANAGVTSANLGMKGYVDSTNQGTISYVNGQINAANVGVLLANSGMKGYVDSTVSSNVSTINNSLTAANVGMKGYVDFANTIQSNQIGAANLAITAANIGMRGYVDSTVSSNISTVSNSITAANVGLKGYVDQANTVQQSYIDGQIAAANTASYSNAKVATYLSAGNIANVSVAGNVTATFFIGNGALLTGITTGSSYSNVQVATYLPTHTGTVSASLVNSSGNVLANTISAVTVNSGLVNSTGNVLGATASFGAINSTGFVNTLGNLSVGGNVALFGNTRFGTAGAVSGAFHNFVGNINQYTAGGAVYFNTTGNVLGAGANFGTIRTTGNLIFANTYIPTAANSVGTQGQISFDGLYIYICIATNLWRRANVAAW